MTLSSGGRHMATQREGHSANVSFPRDTETASRPPVCCFRIPGYLFFPPSRLSQRKTVQSATYLRGVSGVSLVVYVRGVLDPPLGVPVQSPPVAYLSQQVLRGGHAGFTSYGGATPSSYSVEERIFLKKIEVNTVGEYSDGYAPCGPDSTLYIP